VPPDDLALAIGVGGHGDYRRDRDDAAALALLEVGRVEPQIGPVAAQRTVEASIDAVIDVFAQLGAPWLAPVIQEAWVGGSRRRRPRLPG